MGDVGLAAMQVVLAGHGVLMTTSREIPWAGTEISRSERGLCLVFVRL